MLPIIWYFLLLKNIHVKKTCGGHLDLIPPFLLSLHLILACLHSCQNQQFIAMAGSCESTGEVLYIT